MAVVQAGGIGKAARRLNTSQSAISRSIAELEHAFGVRLLDRSRQGVEPTQYGRALFGCGAAVFDELRQGVKSIEFLADPTVGEIRVAGNEYIIAGLIATAFGGLRQQYPGIAIDVASVGAISEQHRRLRERTVDLVVGRVVQSHEEDIDTEVLFNDRITVVAGLRIHGLAAVKSICRSSPTNPGLCRRLTLPSGCSLPSYSMRAASNFHREAWREARFTWSAR